MAKKATLKAVQLRLESAEAGLQEAFRILHFHHSVFEQMAEEVRIEKQADLETRGIVGGSDED